MFAVSLVVVARLLVAAIVCLGWTIGILVSVVVVHLLHHLLLVHFHLLLMSLSEEHLGSGVGTEAAWVGAKSKALWLSLESNWRRAKILIWVESTKSCHFSKTGNLNHGWWLSVQWAKMNWADIL